MRKFWKFSRDGHKLPAVGVEAGKNGFAFDERHIFIQLPFGWQIFVGVAFSFDADRYKLLECGDMVPYDNVVAPDEWRDQPLRPNGLPW